LYSTYSHAKKLSHSALGANKDVYSVDMKVLLMLLREFVPVLIWKNNKFWDTTTFYGFYV